MVSQYSDYTVYIRVPKRGLYDYSLQSDTKQKYYDAGYSDMKKKWNERCKKYGIDNINDSDEDDHHNNIEQPSVSDATDSSNNSNTTEEDDIHSITESLRASHGDHRKRND
jgi:hypothetical protein